MRLLQSRPGPEAARASSPSGRRRSERRGRIAEWIAAGWLILKGYRILARRVRTPFGEIDLIAARGRRICFCEVKLRSRLVDAEKSVTRRQAARIAQASEYWTWRHAAYRSHVCGLDCIFVASWRLPLHVEDALQPH